jgi:hypothetical protein
MPQQAPDTVTQLFQHNLCNLWMDFTRI